MTPLSQMRLRARLRNDLVGGCSPSCVKGALTALRVVDCRETAVRICETCASVS
jgi:hypothetical protein